MSYTKGKWKVHGGPGRLHHHLAVIDSIPDIDGKVMANCICHVATSNDDSDANARLIAAAPDLLELLKKLRDSDALEDSFWKDDIDAAIKQAEGGE